MGKLVVLCFFCLISWFGSTAVVRLGELVKIAVRKVEEIRSKAVVIMRRHGVRQLVILRGDTEQGSWLF